jgi:general stress protein 26
MSDVDEGDWTICFVTGGRSRKASDVRRAGKVGLIFQHDQDDAFVLLCGRAALIETATEVRRLWKNAYNAYFPTEATNAMPDAMDNTTRKGPARAVCNMGPASANPTACGNDRCS